MASLRRYLTQTELQTRRPSIVDFDETTLILAEQDIDQVLARQYQGLYVKAYNSQLIQPSLVFNDTIATLSNFSSSDGYLDRTVVEIVAGANSGSRFLVDTQVGNTLTFFESTGVTGTLPVRIYQIAKAPFTKDVTLANNVWYKTIDERIKEAVAYQYEFRVAKNNDFNNPYPQTSYQVSQDQYQENFDVKAQQSIRDRISPLAWDILGDLTVQSL